MNFTRKLLIGLVALGSVAFALTPNELNLQVAKRELAEQEFSAAQLAKTGPVPKGVRDAIEIKKEQVRKLQELVDKERASKPKPK